MPFSELFFLSCLFSTEAFAPVKLKSISGFLVAFFRRCLIYNVLICLAPLPQALALGFGAFLSYHTHQALSRTFFRNFFGFQPLFPFRSSAALCSLIILSGLSPFVKPLFRLSFEKLPGALPWLFPVQISPPAPGQLRQYTTPHLPLSIPFFDFFASSGYNYDTMGWYSF